MGLGVRVKYGNRMSEKIQRKFRERKEREREMRKREKHMYWVELCLQKIHPSHHSPDL